MRDTQSIMNRFNKVGILGIARSGIAAAQKLQALGIDVFLSDCKAELHSPVGTQHAVSLLDGCNYELGGHSERLLEQDLLIVSPGIPLTIPILLKAKEKNIPLWSEIELGYRLTHPDTKIIAVTGSNGKSTTASLIAHILNEAGYDTILAGNIGDAYCGFDIENKHDFIVLEISSFQLELIETFKPNVAIILNITPDHLDRYKDIYEYAQAKLNIFKNCPTHDNGVGGGRGGAPTVKILNKNDQISQSLLTNKNIPLQSFSFFSETDAMHYNYTFAPNIPPARLATAHFVDDPTIDKALDTFKPLEHRLEFVTEINGIKVINDSKATNTDSVIFALKSITKPIHIILGGSDKGEDYDEMTNQMVGKVKKAYIIGQTAPAIAKTCQHKIDHEIYPTFEAAIYSAINNATAGEIVLLSPACASFDMFKNYDHRGKEFKRIVLEAKSKMSHNEESKK